ncbi:carboxypeptidase N subunit 2-like [Planococcus citri]|uniref:carboxypeptidase N subunit 2-like n=1 Tax=Planococcus citri TaxID=170843 RepID=UPI0031F7C4A7
MIGAVKNIIFLLLVYAWTETYATKHDWMQCHDVVNGCICKWVGGRKTATCTRALFTDIPQGFSDEIQSLVLDYTEIRTLKNDAFRQAGLINLQKISMKYCNIREIEKNTFAGLSIVIQIDLSGNQIRKLDPKLFVPTEKLRHVYLNNNSIARLEDGLFVDLKFLQTVEFEENQISYIGHKAFDNIPQLKNVKLNNNQLNHLNKTIFEKFTGSLKSLELKNNPWKCDCHLRDFVVWYTERLYTDPISCFGPGYLAGLSWDQIQPEQFVCKVDVGTFFSLLKLWGKTFF